MEEMSLRFIEQLMLHNNLHNYKRLNCGDVKQWLSLLGGNPFRSRGQLEFQFLFTLESFNRKINIIEIPDLHGLNNLLQGQNVTAKYAESKSNLKRDGSSRCCYCVCNLKLRKCQENLFPPLGKTFPLTKIVKLNFNNLKVPTESISGVNEALIACKFPSRAWDSIKSTERRRNQETRSRRLNLMFNEPISSAYCASWRPTSRRAMRRARRDCKKTTMEKRDEIKHRGMFLFSYFLTFSVPEISFRLCLLSSGHEPFDPRQLSWKRASHF